MTIPQAKNLHLQLEQDIIKLVTEFETATGLVLDNTIKIEREPGSDIINFLNTFAMLTGNYTFEEEGGND